MLGKGPPEVRLSNVRQAYYFVQPHSIFVAYSYYFIAFKIWPSQKGRFGAFNSEIGPRPVLSTPTSDERNSFIICCKNANQFEEFTSSSFSSQRTQNLAQTYFRLTNLIWILVSQCTSIVRVSSSWTLCSIMFPFYIFQ